MSTTFAPPQGSPVVTPPCAPLQPPLEPTGDSRRGRRPLLLLVAVAALVALGVGALVAVAGGSDEGVSLPAAEPFDLAAAAQTTISSQTVEFDLAVSAGDYGTVSMTGAVDNETRLAKVTTDMSGLLGLDEPMLGDAGLEVLVDGQNDVVYLSAEALSGLLPADSAWISLDLARLAEISGTPLEEMRGQFLVDPADAARMLLDADDVTEVGTETIDGVATMHYRVTVDVADALAASPQLGSELGGADVDLPDAVVYDVWVTEANELRRASVDLDVAGQSVSMVLDLTTTDERLDLEIPTSSFDITSWLDW
jgi:hypothetical protein